MSGAFQVESALGNFSQWATASLQAPQITQAAQGPEAGALCTPDLLTLHLPCSLPTPVSAPHLPCSFPTPSSPYPEFSHLGSPHADLRPALALLSPHPEFPHPGSPPRTCPAFLRTRISPSRSPHPALAQLSAPRTPTPSSPHPDLHPAPPTSALAPPPPAQRSPAPASRPPLAADRTEQPRAVGGGVLPGSGRKGRESGGPRRAA